MTQSFSSQLCLRVRPPRCRLLPGNAWKEHSLKNTIRLSCVQAVMQLRAELALGGAAALERQGFLDTAQEILSQFAAGTGDSAAAATAEAKMRLFLAQVQVLPSPDAPVDLNLIGLSAELLRMHFLLPAMLLTSCAARPEVDSPGELVLCGCASV